MRISGQEVKNLSFSSDDNDFDDRINYPIKEIWMNENYLEVFFFTGKGPSRSSAEMEKYEYRKSGEWIERSGRILSWNELYDYIKIFSVEKESKQMKVSEANAVEFIFSSDKNEADDRINYKAIDIEVVGNNLTITYAAGPSGRKTTVISKDRYRKGGDWIVKGGVIMSWDSLAKWFGAKEEAMKTFEQFHAEGFIPGEITIQNIGDLANLVKGIRVINRDTGVIENPNRDIHPLNVALKKYGYNRSVDYNAGEVTFRKSDSPRVVYWYSDDAKTQMTIYVGK